jgi:hypothetical protein
MGQWDWAAPQTFTVLVVAMAIRALSLEQNVTSLQNDEFYHLLAADGWLHESSFSIANGHYPRAAAFTWLVAQFMWLVPNNILIARLPAMIAGGLLAASVFVWTRPFGKVAAWTAALLICFSDISVTTSQLVRFYSLHQLAFWTGSIALYAALYDQRPHRILWACASIASLSLALHLQTTTLIGMAALGTWVSLVWIVAADPNWRRQRAVIVIVLAAAILLIVWFARNHPFVAELFAKYRWTATWAASGQDNWLYYVRRFARDFGSTCFFAAFAAMFAARRAAHPALFCLTLVIVPLAIHSGAGMKGMRFISYALPYLFVLSGLAVESFVVAINEFICRTEVRLKLPRLAEATIGWLVIGMTLAVTPAVLRTVHTVAMVQGGGSAERESSAWAAAVPELRTLVGNASVFVTRDDTRALFFLGGYDLMLDRTRRDDYAPGREFAIDPRTGGSAIATAPSMRLVMDCYPSGVVVVAKNAWRDSSRVTDDVADLIEERAKHVQLQSTDLLRVYQWRHEVQADLPDCKRVYQSAGDSGHAPLVTRH